MATTGTRVADGPRSGPVRRVAPLWSGPGCPRCGCRRIWTGWADVARRCPECDLDLHRHGWLAAMWIDTWLTVILVVGWIGFGMVATGGRGPAWVTLGAVAIAVVTPLVSYRYAKAMMLRLLHRLDPPQPTGAAR